MLLFALARVSISIETICDKIYPNIAVCAYTVRLNGVNERGKHRKSTERWFSVSTNSNGCSSNESRATTSKNCKRTTQHDKFSLEKWCFTTNSLHGFFLHLRKMRMLNIYLGLSRLTHDGNVCFFGLLSLVSSQTKHSQMILSHNHCYANVDLGNELLAQWDFPLPNGFVFVTFQRNLYLMTTPCTDPTRPNQHFWNMVIRYRELLRANYKIAPTKCHAQHYSGAGFCSINWWTNVHGCKLFNIFLGFVIIFIRQFPHGTEWYEPWTPTAWSVRLRRQDETMQTHRWRIFMSVINIYFDKFFFEAIKLLDSPAFFLIDIVFIGRLKISVASVRKLREF